MNSRRMVTLAVPVLIVAAIAVIVLVSPQEATLGAGIKSVYVHVSLTWTGMLGLTLSGLLGIVVLLRQSARLERWAQTLGWAALALFSSGFLMSMLAAQVNWGGVFWAEPRTAMATQIIAVTLIAQILSTWVKQVRLQGLLHLLAVAFMTWRVATTELVLHPQSPIMTSDARPIQLTFAVMFLLVAAAAGWLVWRLVPRPEAQ